MQRHKLFDLKFENEKIKNVASKITGRNNKNKTVFSDNFLETNTVAASRLKYKTAKFFNRVVVHDCYFDSPAYKRSNLGNCFVCFVREGGSHQNFGKIQYYMEISERPYSNATVANVLLFSTCDIGSVKGFFYLVKQTSVECLVPIEKLQKVF